jgi:hypothetical protein
MHGVDYLSFLRKNFMREPRRMTSMALVSAFAKILETVSLVLPLKGVFILMNPTMLPKILTERGIGVNEVMILISCAVVGSFLLAKLFQFIAHNLAHKAILGDDSEFSDARTKLTVKLSSSLLTMLLFLLAITLLYYPAALLIIGLISTAFLTPSIVVESHRFKLVKFVLGVGKSKQAQYRLLANCLFLTFFILIVGMTLTGLLHVDITLLFTVLITRQLLQEYAALMVSVFTLDHLLKTGLSPQKLEI